MANTYSVVVKPHMWWRLLLSVVLGSVIVVGFIAKHGQQLVQTKAALASVNSGTAANAVNNAIISADGAGWMTTIASLLLGLIWAMYAVEYVRFLRATPRLSGNLPVVLAIVGLIGLASITGCGPYKEEQFEEVAPNETAFVIPLDGSKEEQEKFKSLEYLTSAKVSAKRIPIPLKQHDTGRTMGAFKWIPTVKVVKVDRSPITREWTKKKDSGSSLKDQAIAVESAESVGFSAGISITVAIHEDDTAKFLYHYFGKKLEDVVDQNVRSYVQMVLAREFGNRTLTVCMAEKAKVFKMCFDETKAQFVEQGLTVEYLGSSEGLTFDNPKIQEAIDKKFVAENEILVADQEAKSATKRNEISVAKAAADADIRIANAKADAIAAQEFVKAGDAMILKAKLDIAKAQAEAMKTAAEKWNGSVPANILPAGTNMMFGLDRPVSTDSLSTASVAQQK